MSESSRSKRKLGFIIALVGIVLFAGISLYNYWRYKNLKGSQSYVTKPVPVETARAHYAELEDVLELTGDIRPLQEVYVSPKVPGKIIEKIFVETGDIVKKGELLASLEKDTIMAQIQQAKAQLASTRAKLNEVEANLALVTKDRKRLENLFQKKAIPQQKLDEVNAKYNAMLATKRLVESQIATAKASLHLLEILLKDHNIYAPVSGYISARYLDAGNMSDTKKPIVRITMEDSVKILTTVTEKFYPFIKKGMLAEVHVDAYPNEVFKGVVSIVNPTLSPATRTAEIEIRVKNKDSMLRAGMFAHIRLMLGKKKALVIPTDALNRLPGTGSYFVYCAVDGKAVLKNVKVGEIQGKEAEIIEGLTENDIVIFKGQNRVRDGSPIRIVNAGSKRSTE